MVQRRTHSIIAAAALLLSITAIHAEPVSPPSLTKSFATPSSSDSINLGDTTTLTFTIQAPNGALTGIGFFDPLPQGLMIATPNGLTGSCGDGTITAPAGGTIISLGSASLAAGASCTFSVNVIGIAGGLQINTSSQVTSNEAGPGPVATASVFVADWWMWFFR